MTKKFIIQASELIFYSEEIEAEDEFQAKDLFKTFYKAGTVFSNNTAGLEISSIEEVIK